MSETVLGEDPEEALEQLVGFKNLCIGNGCDIGKRGKAT